MADDTDDKAVPAGTIKIKRTRRRVYEEAPEPPEAAAETGIMGSPRGERIALPTEGARQGEERAVLPPQEAGWPQGAIATPAQGDRQQEALRLVRKYMLFSAGAGLAPIPCFDLLAVTVLQSRMLKKLCTLYGLNYSGERAKSLVAALVGGIYAGLIAGSMARLIPIVGLVSLATIPAASGALTYAVGRVFIQHFESGGTFLDFDPAKVRKYFAEQYEQARKMNPAA
ncbi:MAG: YcjF family protein [Deltaproteobacteria bacterium]|nr:YcjF family protein [Deltaproteobacteria bacterium]